MHPSALRTDYITRGGVAVTRTRTLVPRAELDAIRTGLDDRVGAVLESTYPHAGRHRERTVGFIDPIMRLTSTEGSTRLELLAERGQQCFERLCIAAENKLGDRFAISRNEVALVADLKDTRAPASEEDRTSLPSAFDMVRIVIDRLASPVDDLLGLYGAVAYDAAFAFDAALQQQHRRDGQRDFVLYLPDRILVTYPGMDEAIVTSYSFDSPAHAMAQPLAVVDPAADPPRRIPQRGSESGPTFADGIAEAKHAFARGDLFEVVLSQSYERAFTDSPSALYERVLAANPAPYAAHLNLGRAEHLVIVSPEMFVRSRGRRIESAPIAGTAARGANAIEDFQILRDLLLSDKADSELVMCTDVDRNDKSLVCEPGSVQVIAHRDVETTPRLMHTVEHITGTLRDGYSALDAFISHMWAVTVTGAPKIGAIQFIEAVETSARGWYAGAFGAFLCNGDMDFGITIRAIHLVDGMARVRAGNSLLARSVTAYEEAECALKAAALLDAIDQHPGGPDLEVPPDPPTPQGLRVLIVDHEDSFVHTLADYFRRAGCDTTTIRSDRGTGIAEAFLEQASPDLIVLSPGPGSPGEFGTGRVLAYATSRRIPVFGVCLGMQAIGEYLGAELKPLPAPAHGVRSAVSRIDASELLQALPKRFDVGRYHSLHIDCRSLPDADVVTARTPEGIAMALEVPELGLYGVQFHPESIMTAVTGHGQAIVDQAVRIASGLRIGAAR